jgi:transcriptional regulator with PAS, ATPase and Fis domain
MSDFCNKEEIKEKLDSINKLTNKRNPSDNEKKNAKNAETDLEKYNKECINNVLCSDETFLNLRIPAYLHLLTFQTPIIYRHFYK